jgi:beta-glucosidase-like glycosyl hydrolase
VTFRGVTISDNLEAGALVNVTAPAKTAIDAGLDLLLYAGSESASRYAYTKLLGEAEAGIVDTSRIAQAYGKIETLKKNLGLR